MLAWTITRQTINENDDDDDDDDDDVKMHEKKTTFWITRLLYFKEHGQLT